MKNERLCELDKMASISLNWEASSFGLIISMVSSPNSQSLKEYVMVGLENVYNFTGITQHTNTEY